MITGIIILTIASIVNLGLSFLFSLIETALIITDDIRIRIMINKAKNDKIKNRLIKILEKRDKHGAALSVVITLTNVTGSSALGSLALFYLPTHYVLAYTLIITYLMLVFARTIPKIYARKVNEKVLRSFSWLIRGIYFFSIPILAFTLIWVKIFRLSSNKKKLSITDLRGIIEVYKDSGVLAKQEHNILESVFAVKEQLVENFIQKEKEIYTLKGESSVSVYEDIITKYQSKKFFIKIDENVVGIARKIDLLSYLASKDKSSSDNLLVKDFMKKSVIIQGSEKLIDIIVKMEKKKLGQAIVLDTEGNPMGIISLKDIYLFLLGKKS